MAARNVTWAALALAAAIGTAHAAAEIPPAAELAARAARRMPQKVRVGDLDGRQVLEPSNRQGVLGRVAGVYRTDAGGLVLVFRYGGVLGHFTRPVGVPVDATALLGQFVQVTDIDPAQLALLPDWTGAGATRLGADEVIRVGVNRN